MNSKQIIYLRSLYGMALREGFKQRFSWSTDKPVVFAKYAQLTDIGRVACNRTPDYTALGNR